MGRRTNRRDFLKATALAGAGFWAAAGTAPAQQRSPSEKLNLGIIGSGGRGGANLNSVSSENIVALCDVDERNLGKAAQKYPKARKYTDFRKLYDDSKDLDAVVVSTTEHTHVFAVLPALRLGKHVYCEKPLAHTVEETRAVREAAKKARVVTQMGTQIHASDNYRRVVELVQAGAIGPVRECHVWVSRAWGWQSEEDAKRYGDRIRTIDRPRGESKVPAGLDWELWLGPAPRRPYHDVYLPGPNWYRWWDFGNGTMADLGSHWIDLPFWALRLDAPRTIEAAGPPPHPEIAPASMRVIYEFGPRGDLPAVKLGWYQGTMKPDLVAQGKVPAWGNGVLFIGDRGMLLSGYGKHVLLPEKEFESFKRPEQSIARSPGQHQEWILACKTGSPTLCHFDYSGALTESNILGSVAYRVGKKIEWDPRSMKVLNCPEAEKYIRKEYHKGWSLS
jgi:predicted dehydrogenase